MNRTLPLAALLSLGLAALVVVLVGCRLANKTETVKTPSREKVVQQFAAKVDKELERLNTLYESYLLPLAMEHDDIHGAHLKQAAVKLPGVVEVSDLYISDDKKAKHRVIGQRPDVLGRVRWLHAERSETVTARLFDRDYYRKNADQSKRYGWRSSMHPRYVYFWAVRERPATMDFSETILRVICVDRAKVVEVINGSLAKSMRADFEVVGVEPGFDVLLDEWGQSVFRGGQVQADRPADSLIVIKSEIANWKILSWSAISERKYWDYRLLFGSILVGILMLGIGVWAYQKLGSAFQLAEQRVSFVNSVSHELGTPLTNVMLNLDLAAETLEEEQQKYAHGLVTMAREECSRLGRLIHNVLTFSRCTNNLLTVDLVEVDVEEVTESAVGNFVTALSRRGIVVRCDHQDGVKVLADRDSLQQILSNLISNVEKYGSSESELVITSSATSGGVEISVCNEGERIPVELQEKVFEPYFRVGDNSTEGVAGTGIGLPISRQLARVMNGDLVYVSKESGSCFVVKLKEYTN